MCIWTADCMRRKKSRKCVCNRGKSQIERERERNEKERIHCFENGSYILFNTTTASSNSCSRLLNTQAYIEKPWVALDRQVLFFLCLVYSFLDSIRKRENVRLRHTHSFYRRTLMITFVYFRERTRKEEDRREHRKQYLFLNTHHYAVVEKQEKKKIPALTKKK